RPGPVTDLVVAVDRARKAGGARGEAMLVVDPSESVSGGRRRSHRKQRGADAVHRRLSGTRLEVVLARGRRLETRAWIAVGDQEPGRAADRRIDPLEIGAARRRRALVVAPQGPEPEAGLVDLPCEDARVRTVGVVG